MSTTIYRARRIVTLNPSRPEGTHVAVRDGRVLGVGDLAELTGWGPHDLDERFADKVLVPGFVEGHAHVMEGALWRFVYVGFHDRIGPDGKVWTGLKSIDAMVDRLRAAAEALDDPALPVVGWGFDPIYFPGRRCVREDLDRVSDNRVVAVMHASLHIVNANSVALRRVGWLDGGPAHPGILRDAAGTAIGELRGPEAMMPVMAVADIDRSAMAGDEIAVRTFARLCVRKGVTTVTDLACPINDQTVTQLRAITDDPQFPVRYVPLLRLLLEPVPETIERAVAIKAQSTDRLRLGHVKVVADGSIQGFSARLRWPGYYNGAPNGLWYTPPEQLLAAYRLALRSDILIHTHTNGDEATDLALDCLGEALDENPRRDHRFTLQHCQLADAAQFRRMRELGMCVNLFANHHFYWGDEHYRLTVGPERATRMNACATALASGVPFSIHSDAPVTPLGPLFTIWCAVNRVTASGRVLGARERISAEAALRAMTLGAAWTLKLDGEVGTIECGKSADFAVLNDDPLAVDPTTIRDIGVWGTVQGGRVFAAD